MTRRTTPRKTTYPHATTTTQRVAEHLEANLDPEKALAPAADDSIVEAVAKAKAQRVVDHLEGHTVGALERVLGRVVG
jgi:hypothetical protein